MIHPRCFRIAAVLALAVILPAAGCKVKIGEGDRAWNEYAAPLRHDLDMGSYAMHYIDAGQSEPVLMIHGFADSSYTFHENARAITDAGYRALIVDQPGLGRSTVPPESFVYSIENLSEEIIRFADKFGIDKFHLVGSSMGGGISLYLAVHYPERVRGAILLDPACFRLEGEGPFRLVSIPASADVVAAFAGRWTGVYALHDVYFDRSKVTDELVDEYARPLNKPGYRRVLVQLIKRYFSDGFDRMTQRYGEIKAPILIVWGDHDKWVPVKFGERLKDRIPGSRLVVVKDCGHLPHQELPQTVNPLMTEFLKETSLGRP